LRSPHGLAARYVAVARRTPKGNVDRTISDGETASLFVDRALLENSRLADV
jgi:hypothetical protein